MCKLTLYILSWATLSVTINAFPRETTRDGLPLVPATTTPAASMVTEAPYHDLRCSDGSTVLHTTDCTMGTPVVYCFQPPPPITCNHGYFPSVWHPEHCLEESTCFPTDADWITTECHNGAFPFSTSTLYEGTLADGHWTAISGKRVILYFEKAVQNSDSAPRTFCRVNSRGLVANILD